MSLSPALLMATAVLIAGAVGAFVFVAGHEADCANRWSASGFEWRYDQGQCMVLAGSRWLPETSVRIHVREPG